MMIPFGTEQSIILQIGAMPRHCWNDDLGAAVRDFKSGAPFSLPAVQIGPMTF